MIRKKRPQSEADLKLIVAQGEAILARLENIDLKIEHERSRREEELSVRADERRTRDS